MAHTYTVLLYHIIFSTKHRKPILTSEARDLLFPYISGIISNLGGKALIINGVADHIHILCQLRTKPDVAEVVQSIKGKSTYWLNRESELPPIHWQEGYAAFTVSYSQQNRVYQYIAEQESHHKKKSFDEEFEEILKKHEIEYDPRFFLD